MRLSHAAFVFAMFCALSDVLTAQSPASGAPAHGEPPAAPAPSAMLRPSLDNLQKTLSALNLDKWKRGTVREEAASNISTIMRDMESTLPALLKVADAAPEKISKVLPVSRNVDALYDVLVHVVEASRVSAPGDQAGQLQQAMVDMEKTRIALGDRLQEIAVAQEKQLLDLHTTVQAQAAFKCPAPPPSVTPACAPSTPKVKRKPKPHPTATQTPAAPVAAKPPAPK